MSKRGSHNIYYKIRVQKMSRTVTTRFLFHLFSIIVYYSVIDSWSAPLNAPGAWGCCFQAQQRTTRNILWGPSK